MQTRIQLTIKHEDKDTLFDRELELGQELGEFVKKYDFDVEFEVYRAEPEAE
jgi:hypothetical protein